MCNIYTHIHLSWNQKIEPQSLAFTSVASEVRCSNGRTQNFHISKHSMNVCVMNEFFEDSLYLPLHEITLEIVRRFMRSFPQSQWFLLFAIIGGNFKILLSHSKSSDTCLVEELVTSGILQKWVILNPSVLAFLSPGLSVIHQAEAEILAPACPLLPGLEKHAHKKNLCLFCVLSP